MQTANTAAHLGREQTVEAGGRTWTLGRWDRSVWWGFLEWARSRIPDPVQAAAETVAGLADRQADALARAADRAATAAQKAKYEHLAAIHERQGNELLRVALDKKSYCLTINSPEVAALIQDGIEGAPAVLHLLMRKHHPEATLDDAFELAFALGDRIGDVFGVAQGKPPGEAPGKTSGRADAE